MTATTVAIPGAGPVAMAAAGSAGSEQVRSIVAAIAGDHAAAARVELVLPETGVCRGPGLREAETSTVAVDGCCGGPALQDPIACPAADEVAKEAGMDGCGCGPAANRELQGASCC